MVDKNKIDEMIAVQLIPAITKMLKVKDINAKIQGACTMQNILYIDLLIDVPDSPQIAKVEIKLDLDILTEENTCQGLEQWGKFANLDLDIITRVKLRILRVVWDVYDKIRIGAMNKHLNDKLIIEFGDELGTLYYHN